MIITRRVISCTDCIFNMILISCSFSLGFKIDDIFVNSHPMRVLILFCITCVSIITFTFCSFITTELSVRKPYETIDSLKSLVDSRIPVKVFEYIYSIYQNQSHFKLIDTIIENAFKEKGLIGFGNKSKEEKWMRGLSDRRHAVMIVEMPFKKLLTKLSAKMSPDFKLINLKEFCVTIDPVIAFRYNLSKSFKQHLNLK